MPEIISVNVSTKDFDRLAAVFEKAGKNVKPALARAINHTGDKARTQVVRALVKQTGAKYGVIRRALTTRLASPGGLIYRIIGKGGFMSLREFAARQTAKGVSAAPWGKRRVFPHTFIAQSLGGHVFERRGKARLPIRKLWGPAVPRELVKDQSKIAFETTVTAELSRRIEHEVSAILRGASPS
jgi:hypothetical protein